MGFYEDLCVINSVYGPFWGFMRDYCDLYGIIAIYAYFHEFMRFLNVGGNRYE